MKVVCDNCRAVYKVPDDKLTKAVNKATCRNCGHRMLIPRPKPNADPEERTLVTAVPPTPVGAPPREGVPDSGRGANDLHMPTPVMSPRVDQTLPGPEEDFDGPDTKLAISPNEQDTAREAAQRAAIAARSPGSLPPGRTPPMKRPTSPPSAAPPPGAVSPLRKSQTPLGSSREMALPHNGGRDSTRDPITPRQAMSQSGTSHAGSSHPGAPARNAPPPRSGTYPAMALHDPAGDLNWALLGTATALIGGFLLAFLSIWNHPLVMWFGLAMTFGGGLLTFMVLLTGGRGRRPAKTFLSVLFGGVFAVVTSTMMVATKWGAERVIDAYDISFSDVSLRSGTSTPTVPSLAGEAPGLGTVAPVAPSPGVPAPGLPAPTAPSQVAEAPPAPVPVAPAAVQPAQPSPVPVRPTPVPVRPAPPTRTQPTPVPVAPTPAPPPPTPVPVPVAPTPAPTVGMQTVPMEVIYVMLSNNLEVKKCFVPMMKAGTLPPQIDLKFNIMPEGRATNAMVLQSDFRGSDLEACLVRAVTGITFPPTSGSGTAITFPFVLAR